MFAFSFVVKNLLYKTNLKTTLILWVATIVANAMFSLLKLLIYEPIIVMP
jgi:hypothetical protein